METLFDVTPPARGPQATASELAKRDAALSAHEDNYRDVLRQLRHEMQLRYIARHSRMGNAAYVTADDARHILATHEAFAGMTFPSMNWLGQLFRDGEWEKTGDRITSKTPGSHGNDLPCWRLKENR